MPPDRAIILNSQRRRVLEIVQSHSFDPAEFVWTEELRERIPMTADEAFVSRLVYAPTDYGFTFDLRNEHFWFKYSPSEESPETWGEADDWEDMLRFVGCWLVNLKRETIEAMASGERIRYQGRALLRGIYELAGEDTSRLVALADAASKAGLDKQSAVGCADYLVNEHLVAIVGESGDEQRLTISHEGIKEVEKAIEVEMPHLRKGLASRGPVEGVHGLSGIKLFISHSSCDVVLASALVDLFRSALNLRPDEIRCTSVDGCRLRAGADFEDQILSEICSTPAFVGLITPSSLQSAYVVFELGARWGLRKHLIPLLAKGVEAKQLEGPISQLNALQANERGQLQQLVGDVADLLGVRLSSAPAYEKQLQATLDLGTAG